MNSVWIRRLVPAGVVAIVLAFSYFSPALGFTPDPVKSAAHTNCGRFGDGYHGGKHNFVCPNAPGPPPAVRQVPPGTGQGSTGTGGSATEPAAAAPRGSTLAGAVTTGAAAGQVSVGVSEWRAFTRLVQQELE